VQPQPSSPSAPVALSRANRRAVAVLAAALLVICAALLARSAAEPLAPPPADEAGAPYQLDLNRAQWFELSLVPGLGEVLSKKIVEYRQAHGPFRSVDQLEDVRGIGLIKLQQLRPYFTLSDAPPADPPPPAPRAADRG